MLLDDNFVMQGGVRNYLGKTKEVKAPKYWKSSKDSPETELAYITEAEKGLLLDANLHGSLKNGKPNVGASGLLSYDGWGDSDGQGGSDTSGGNAGAEGGQGDGSGGYNSGNNNSQENSPGQNMAQFGTPTAPSSTPSNNNNNDNNYTVPNPELPPGVKDLTPNTPVDPGVAGEWNTNKKTGEFEFTPSTDTITSFSDNLNANLKSNPFGYLTPSATLAKTAFQTLAANTMLGNINFGGSNNNNNNGGGGGGDNLSQQQINQLTTLAPFLISNSVAPKSQVLEYFSNKNTNSNFDFATEYATAKSKVAQTLNNKGAMGMLAVNNSPYYDWLKTKNLDKGIL